MDDILLPVIGDDGLSSNSTMTLPITGADVDEQSCSLLGSVGLLVQALMAVLVLCSLLLKRYRESPRRAWPVWLADVSKQILGQGFLHASNILISTALSKHTEEDACTAYFVSIFVDCTLGVLVIYAGMRTLSYVAIRKMRIEGCKSGQYYHAVHSHKQIKIPSGSAPVSPHVNKIAVFSATDDHDDNDHDEPLTASVALSRHLGSMDQSDAFQLDWWGKQLLIYLMSLCIMKLALLAFFLIPEVFDVGDWLLSWLGYDTRIVFVLMIFPLFMNAFQFMVVDTILKSTYLPHGGVDSGFTTDPDNSTASQGRDLPHDDDDDHERQAFLGRGMLSESDIEQGRPSAQSEPESASSAPPYPTETTRSLRDTAASHRSRLPSPQLAKSTFASRPPPVIHITSASSDRVPTLLSEKTITEVHVSSPTLSGKPISQAMQQTASTDSNGDHGWDWLDEDENENAVTVI